MARWIKQSTAATLKMGPFVDSTDGVTAETGLTISQADVRLSKNGGDFAQKNESTSATHDELGYYDVPVDTTDTNTLGSLKAVVSESGALPVFHEFMVLPANAWDSLFGSDLLQVDQREVGGQGLGAFITTGTVSSASSVTSITITGLATIRKGAVILITSNTGVGGMASVFSHTSGTGATVLESPGLPVQPDNTSTYIVFAGPTVQAIAVNANDRVEADIKEINSTAITGMGAAGSDPWEPA